MWFSGSADDAGIRGINTVHVHGLGVGKWRKLCSDLSVFLAGPVIHYWIYVYKAQLWPEKKKNMFLKELNENDRTNIYTEHNFSSHVIRSAVS